MLPLSCTCSLAREDVSYPNFGGTKAPMVAQRRLNVSTKVLALGGRGLIWIAFGGCRGGHCTRHAPSIAAKARGAIWVITCGTVVCLCVCGVF